MEPIERIEGPIRVVVVDDDPCQLEIQSIFFETEPNITLSTFTSPADAFRGILQNEYDCIMTDYRIEGLDGVEFLSIIRSITKAPVILYTMIDDKELAERALESGADKIVSKRSDFISINDLTTEIINQVKVNRTRKRSEH